MDKEYVHKLEEVVLKDLLPVYKLYYQNQGKTPPPLDHKIFNNLIKKQPALFKPWPLD